MGTQSAKMTHAPSKTDKPVARSLKTDGRRAPKLAVPGGTAAPASFESVPVSVPVELHDALPSPGQPLDAATRARFEPSLGRNLSGVRIHPGPQAARAAASLNARAFTVGQEIFFSAGRYQPQSLEGSHLLAHELAHAVQQRPLSPLGASLPVSQPGDPVEREADRAAFALLAGRTANVAGGSQSLAIHRAPDSPTPPAPEVKPEVTIRQWLEQHQFAPPEEQPKEGERHVLLNGEDMSISAAVKLAAAALSQPPELVNSVISGALALPVATSAAMLPFIGPKNEIPGITNLSGRRDAFGIDPAISKTVEFSTIDDYLMAHGFATPEVRDPAGDKVLFDGKETTVEAVADRALAILGQYPTLKKPDVLAHIRQKYVADRGGAHNQFVFGYTLVPEFSQYVGGTPDPKNPLRTQHQFSFTITRQHHANDSPGLETSFQGSVTLTEDGIQNIQGGVQEAIVKPLLQGWIQVSGLVQLMASANWSKSATGTTVISPAVQATAGGQILVTPTFRAGDYKFLSGHVQLGLQVLGGFQTSPSGTVGVASAGLVLNIPF
jgi:hypothetical protein